MSPGVGRLFTRRAELLRDLADLEIELGRAFDAPQEPSDPADDVLSLPDAAKLLGEPASTFRRRLEYHKALISRPTERRRRYSRAVLEQIKRTRLEVNGMRT